MARHHVVILEAIERCIRAKNGRLMIFAPPGSAKSTYASVVSTTWAMGAFPGSRVLMTSYAATPIIRHSKRARQICASDAYQSIWDGAAKLQDGSKAADEFDLTNGSGLFAAGLLGGLTSSRCDFGIIDDPVAGRQEADSDTVRASTRQAYEDDFLTRLKPNASVVLIQTRWHADDLAGGILPDDYDGRSGPVQCRDGMTWEILCLPAQCERDDDPCGRQPGEMLWPEWFHVEHWPIFQQNPRTWAALYQQRPTVAEGLYFKREDFRRYALRELPGNLHEYMASDFAVKALREKDRPPDCTEHGSFGYADSGDLYVTDWHSSQKGTDETIAAALAMIRRRKPVLWFGEQGVIEHAIGPAIKQAQRQAARDGAPAWCSRDILPSTQDKVAKSAAFAGMVAAGCVWVPLTAWGDALIEQLCAFPSGRFDDKVDVCGMIGRGLDKLHGKRDTASKPEPAVKPFTRRHIEARSIEDVDAERRRREYYA